MSTFQPSYSFEPVSGPTPNVLILGSMPGQASLQAVQYYAHPRNAFWPIAIGAIQHTQPHYQTAHAIPYEERIQAVIDHGVALWDVLAQCQRRGSLDSDIERSSEVVNPIHEWLAKNSSVKRVCFNGKTAAAVFRRHLGASTPLSKGSQPVQFFTLPSTSPAMATLTLPEKAERWKPAFFR